MIAYKSGYKHQLVLDYECSTSMLVDKAVITEYVTLTTNGSLFIKAGYAWDGATGFPDFKSVLRGSLIHDALYQLIRLGVLPASDRKKADEALRVACIEDGMSAFTARAIWAAVTLTGWRYVHSRYERAVMYAP